MMTRPKLLREKTRPHNKGRQKKGKRITGVYMLKFYA